MRVSVLHPLAFPSLTILTFCFYFPLILLLSLGCMKLGLIQSAAWSYVTASPVLGIHLITRFQAPPNYDYY